MSTSANKLKHTLKFRQRHFTTTQQYVYCSCINYSYIYKWLNMSCTVLSATLTAAVFMRSRLTKANIHVVRLQATNLLKKHRRGSLYCMSALSCFHLTMTTRTRKDIAIQTRHGRCSWQSMEQRFGKMFMHSLRCNSFLQRTLLS